MYKIHSLMGVKKPWEIKSKMSKELKFWLFLPLFNYRYYMYMQKIFLKFCKIFTNLTTLGFYMKIMMHCGHTSGNKNFVQIWKDEELGSLLIWINSLGSQINRCDEKRKGQTVFDPYNISLFK